jgi:hypothetical protein
LPSAVQPIHSVIIALENPIVDRQFKNFCMVLIHASHAERDIFFHHKCRLFFLLSVSSIRREFLIYSADMGYDPVREVFFQPFNQGGSQAGVFKFRGK